MTTFVPYQVDYTVKNMSKTFGFSKKRVSFKFGIASNQAIAQGLTGAHCRGSEHEIIFLWSLNSGKRQLLADGKDVHFSESGQNGWTQDQVFQHHFVLNVPGFSNGLRCHFITQPASKDIPGSRPFDLRVNGVPFFSFGKIFQLGTSSMMVRPLNKGTSNRGGGGERRQVDPDDDPYCTPDERRAIAAAKIESLRDVRQHEERSHVKSIPTGGGSIGVGGASRDEGSLISFDDPAPPPMPAPRGHNNQFISSVTLDPGLSGGSERSHNMGQQQQQQLPPAAYGQPAYNNYGMQPPPPQQQQQQQWGQQQPPPPVATALTPYYQPAPQPQATPTGGTYGNYNTHNSFGTPTNAYAPAAYGFAGASPPGQFPNTPNSIASYGSAPAFAQPPPPPAQFAQPPPPQSQYAQQTQQQQPPQQQFNFAQQASHSGY
jgi:hypothetical protein